jgi:dTDP-4-amino-4,6-dideoxygalactose transaminase
MSDWHVPLSDLDYGPEEEEAVLRVLQSKWLSMGAEVEAFESEFAALAGTKHAVAVANGTAALHLAFQSLEIKPGDEVIQPAINFVASANMTLASGAVPVFADIVGIEEPTIDPAEIACRITKRTKAVVVMHYGGYFARMAEILDVCAKRRIPVIEDACHAVGAQYQERQQRPPHGKVAGNLGAAGCFSFFSNKNMAVGEGGMITTNRDDIARRMRSLRSHGMTTLTWDRHRGHASSYDVQSHGYNYRLDEIHAALGRVQLKKLAKNNKRRGRLVEQYRHRLNDLARWTVPFADYSGGSAYHLMTVVAPDVKRRAAAAQALKEARIQTSLHYPFIPAFKAFKSCRADELARSRKFAARTITLPLFPGLSASEVDEICKILCHS